MVDRPSEKSLFPDRRDSTRDRVKIKIQYKNIERLKEEWTENISHGGIFIKSTNPLAVHTIVEVSLSLPNEERPVTLIGEVVRTVSQHEADTRGTAQGFALEFKDFSEKKKEIFESMMKSSSIPPTTKEAVIQLGPPAPNAPVPMDTHDRSRVEEEHSDHIEIKAIQIKNMSVKDKMMLAPKADKAERAILLRDLNASVARLIIRNPRITDTEIAQIAKDFATPADVLEAIVKNRKWILNPEIRLAIVKNPRTPTPLALNQLNYVQVKDLAFIAKSQHVRESIKNEALKLLLKKRDSAR